MREYLRKLKPQSIKDLAAMNALYRPGPMEFINDFIDRRHGRKKVEYLHPTLEPILKETYGIIVYQEQVIQIANKVGGLSLAEADILRRAMGKKDLDKMNEMKEKFVKGAVENNISEKIADEIFQSIFKFANYGFNKSHAVAYSFVAYQTAYLKAHYLAEFLAANLTNEFGNTDKVTVLLDDCRKLGVKVLPPDVNKPSVFFNVENGKVIFGMSAIKNVGVSAVEEISRKRDEIGRDFSSIYDFCSQIDLRIVNKRTIEGLVLAGAFDHCTGTRSQNFAAIESAIDFGNKVQSSTLNAGESLFGDNDESLAIEEPELPEVEQWSQKETLAREREVLGFYLSDHPLHKFEIENKSFANVNLGHTEKFDQESTVRAVGVITEVRTKITKSNKQMAFFKLDDLTGSCECIMFPNVYEECSEFIKEESTILVKGKTESSGDSIKLHIDEAMPLSDAKTSLTKNLVLYLDDEIHTEETVDKLKQMFEQHSGQTPVYVSVKENGDEKRFYLNDYKIKLDNGFSDELIELMGTEYVRFGV
jgi:DNA polymerase-3 subunit alpha